MMKMHTFDWRLQTKPNNNSNKELLKNYLFVCLFVVAWEEDRWWLLYPFLLWLNTPKIVRIEICFGNGDVCGT
jgi:hypothetical protein